MFCRMMSLAPSSPCQSGLTVLTARPSPVGDGGRGLVGIGQAIQAGLPGACRGAWAGRELCARVGDVAAAAEHARDEHDEHDHHDRACADADPFDHGRERRLFIGFFARGGFAALDQIASAVIHKENILALAIFVRLGAAFHFAQAGLETLLAARRGGYRTIGIAHRDIARQKFPHAHHYAMARIHRGVDDAARVLPHGAPHQDAARQHGTGRELVDGHRSGRVPPAVRADLRVARLKTVKAQILFVFHCAPLLLSLCFLDV